MLRENYTLDFARRSLWKAEQNRYLVTKRRCVLVLTFGWLRTAQYLSNLPRLRTAANQPCVERLPWARPEQHESRHSNRMSAASAAHPKRKLEDET